MCSPAPCYFFGTFNPVHTGHLMMAQCTLNQYGEALGFDRVTFIPAGNPPHRQTDMDLAPALDRLQMVRLATANNPAFEVSDIELGMTGLTYTYVVLEKLCAERLKSGQPVYMIIGSDAFSTLGTWHEADKLLSAVTFLQVPRPEVGFQESVPLEGGRCRPKTFLVEMPMISLSSTWIREKVRVGKVLRYVVPESVRLYLMDNPLYLV